MDFDKPPAPVWRIPIRYNAAYLDRRADIELLAGRHAVAERLAHLAAELREVAR